jgi:hypothetical protein
MELKRLLFFSVVILSLLACNVSNPAPSQEVSKDNTVADEHPELAEITDTPAMETAEEVVVPTSTTEPTQTSAPLPDVSHKNIPGEPKYVLAQLITDCQTGFYVEPGEPIDTHSCDWWQINRLERPHNEEFQEYLSQYDIIEAQFGQDDTWLFAQIVTFPATDAANMEGTYAIEIDRDLNMRGDYLIQVTNPTAGDWSVAGVRVWKDTNNDVGSYTAFYADDVNIGDGYEELLFDQGLGDDPDMAWARISPSDPNTVQIAFKQIMIGYPLFEWWAWSSMDQPLNSDYDLVDTFDEHDLYYIDNTCAWIYGGSPRPLDNICGYTLPEVPTPKPGGGGPHPTPGPCQPPSGGCPPGWFWYGEPDCYCQSPPK